MAIYRGFLLLFLALSAGYFAVSRAQDDRCEQGWKYYNGNCYYHALTKVIWRKAQSDCQSKQANLVTVNDANEQKFLTGLWGRMGSWLGLNNQDDLKVFKWVSGEKSSYRKWARNQPRIIAKKRCARGHFILGGKWVMDNCKRSPIRYTCEKASPCASGPCKNGGKCSAKLNGYQCQCPDGFTGKRCETSSDPCSPNPCQNEGTCYDLLDGTYFCSCKSGFTGNSCQKLNCKTYPCRNGGTCVDLVDADTAICSCPSGFTGNVCQGKVPSITQNPKDAVGMAGEDVTFCCDAEGEPAPTFSWLYNEVPMENQASKNLRLTGLSTDGDGLYKCRATNKYGKVVSREAKLTVIAGGDADSCDPTPLTKLISLPVGCTEISSGSNTVNVGTCSYDECIKRGQGGSGNCGGGEDNTKRCCSPTSMVDSQMSCTNGLNFNLQKVRDCSCSVCAVPDIVIHGRVVDEDGNPLKKGVVTVAGENKKYYTDLDGYFKLTVKSGTKRLVLNFKDPFGNLQETTKALDLHAGQVSFYTIVLQKKPPAIKFAATQKQNIPLGAPSKPNFVAVDIPAKAFTTNDGNVYEGEIIANIGVIDPRSEADMAAAPGDFSAIDDNGEELMLGTAGILRQSFTDSNGNKLNLDKNITIRIDAGELDIPDGVTVNQYYMDDLTGRWVKFGVLRTEEGEAQGGDGRTKRQAAKKFFVGEITPNVPYDTINWDYVSTASYVRVVAPPGTVVTRIHRSGQSYTSYRQETVPSSGILCMLSLRDTPAVMQAELNGAPLIPQQPSNFPTGVITENPPIIDGNAQNNPFKIQSIQYTSVATDGTGPIYTKYQSSRCQQRGSGDLAFEFQEAGPGEAFHWESPRETDPNSNLIWNVLSNQICFVKALVRGSKPESVIYVKSTGKATGQSVLDYGYTAEKPAMVGNEGVVCLEYRCNEPRSAYQTHLQFITLTGTCTIPSLNSVLNDAQNRCGVTPDPDSSQEQNFCVPKDLQGGDAGLYIGDTGVAKSRCLRGDNNYNQGRPTTTNANPTLTLNCS